MNESYIWNVSTSAGVIPASANAFGPVTAPAVTVRSGIPWIEWWVIPAAAPRTCTGRCGEIAGPVLGGEDDRAAAVGHHAAVELVERIGDELRTEHVVDGDRIAVHGVRVAAGVLADLHRDRRELLRRRAVLVHVALRRQSRRRRRA